MIFLLNRENLTHSKFFDQILEIKLVNFIEKISRSFFLEYLVLEYETEFILKNFFKSFLGIGGWLASFCWRRVAFLKKNFELLLKITYHFC